MLELFLEIVLAAAMAVRTNSEKTWSCIALERWRSELWELFRLPWVVTLEL